MKWSRIMAASALLGAFAFAPPAAADKPEGKDAKEARQDARKDLKEARQDAKDARKDLKEARKDLREALKDGGADSPAAKEAKDDLKDARKDLREARRERAKAKKAELKAKWGDLLGRPAVKQELRLHAMRMAKLHRMAKLAKEKGKDDLAKRVDALVAKENARHDKRMEQLKTQGGDDNPGAAPGGGKPEEKK